MFWSKQCCKKIEAELAAKVDYLNRLQSEADALKILIGSSLEKAKYNSAQAWVCAWNASQMQNRLLEARMNVRNLEAKLVAINGGWWQFILYLLRIK